MDNISQELSKLIEICHSNLKTSSKCLDYLLKERKLSLDEINRYKLGFFPQSVKTLKKYISEEVLLKLSIIDSYGNSTFADYHYLIFPIYSEYNDPVGIAGRTLLSEQERKTLNLPKYKNSSFKKTQNLYGLNFSKPFILKKNNVYIVEGYFDYMALESNNIKNAVAICGTAFSKSHFLKLARFTDQITFLLDGDDAGKSSTERIESKFSNKGVKLRFEKLPSQYKDSDEYFNISGHNAFTFVRDIENIVPGIW